MAHTSVTIEMIKVTAFDSGLILFDKNSITKPAINGQNTIADKVLSKIFSNL